MTTLSSMAAARSTGSKRVARSTYCFSSRSRASSVTVGRTLSASRPLYCFRVITGRTVTVAFMVKPCLPTSVISTWGGATESSFCSSMAWAQAWG